MNAFSCQDYIYINIYIYNIYVRNISRVLVRTKTKITLLNS